jgi:hypothetical protein
VRQRKYEHSVFLKPVVRFFQIFCCAAKRRKKKDKEFMLRGSNFRYAAKGDLFLVCRDQNKIFASFFQFFEPNIEFPRSRLHTLLKGILMTNFGRWSVSCYTSAPRSQQTFLEENWLNGVLKQF